MKPQPSKSFIVSYFSRRITKLNDTLAEMLEAAPGQEPAFGRYLSHQLEDLQAEVEHVLEFGETSGWPVHQLWENKLNTGTPEN